MDVKKEAVALHKKLRGKISVVPTVKVETKEDLSLVYTPGVAEVCLEIAADREKSFEYTRRWNTVAVITDGTAVLGLGDIGPEAGMPVMEGKCLLFREFAGIDAIPICLDTKDPDEIVSTVRTISKSFGGINLEDISAPRCFEIEARLKALCDIPVFHDDQHGTAVVVTAALINALKVAGKDKKNIKLVINGAGSAGCAIGKLLASFGVENIIYVDRLGAICEGGEMLNSEHERLSHISNPNHESGSLEEVLRGADVFIGVSRPGLLSAAMIKSMADKSIIFAMANPTPEIMPDEAMAAGAYIVGTGRSDFPNQINNLLAFPGIFRGALDARAADITEDMKVAAANAIASVVTDEERGRDYIIPSPFNKDVVKKVALAVAEAWKNK